MRDFSEDDVFQERRLGQRITPYLSFVSAAAILSTFNYGFHTGVLNNPKDVISSCPPDAGPHLLGINLPPCFEIDEALWGTIVGMFAIGGLAGGIAGGWLANHLGRSKTLFWNNFFFILGSALLGFAATPPMLILGRISVGVGSGIATVVVPMYLGEISPTKYRGAFGVLTQLSVTIGISVSQLLGLALSKITLWRWLVSASFFLSLMQCLLLPFAVQTPRWLIMKNHPEEAKRALKKIRGRVADQTLNAEIEHIAAGQMSTGTSPISIRDLLNRNLRRSLIIALALQIIQQFSGINAVFYYSTDIFKKAGAENPEIFTASVGALNVLLTIISVFLMDRAGRRFLLLFGELGMVLTSICYTFAFFFEVAWLSILCTYVYVAFFAIGLGPIPFLIIAEIFPTSVLATAASVALPLNWSCNYLVGQLFPLMSEGLGSFVFMPFAVVLLFGFAFTFWMVPETKGKTLEQITAEMRMDGYFRLQK